MRNTIKLKIQIAIAIIIAIVSGVQAWISVSQLKQETTSALNSEMANVSDVHNMIDFEVIELQCSLENI